MNPYTQMDHLKAKTQKQNFKLGYNKMREFVLIIWKKEARKLFQRIF